MGAIIDDKEKAMAVLNGLPPRYETIITALDAIGDDDPSFTFDKVRRCLLQEETRSAMRAGPDRSSGPTALLNISHGSSSRFNKKVCSHWGKTNHTEPNCWKKYGRPGVQRGGKTRRAGQDRNAPTAAIVSAEVLETAQEEEEYTDYVSMVANTDAGSPSRNNLLWHIGSAATAHMTFDKSRFVNYESVTPFPVRIGDSSTAIAIGRGDVHLQIANKGKRLTCILRDVLHIPSFVYYLISVTALVERGLYVQFHEDRAKLLSGSTVITTGTRVRGCTLLTYTVQVMAATRH